MNMVYTFKGGSDVGRKHCYRSSFQSLKLLFVIGFALCHSLALAKDTHSSHQESTSRFTSSVNTLSDQQRASFWDLDLDEWKEYKRLMQGPRGLWTPELDPVHVLGINAKTEGEREKYAMKMARMEYARMEREGAFSKAYHQQYNKLLGDTVMYPVTQKKDDSNRNKYPETRLKFFVTLPCDGPACKFKVTGWIQNGDPFDAYFIGANNHEIKLWAQKMGIPPLLVKSGQITLNHVTKAQATAMGATWFPGVVGRH